MDSLSRLKEQYSQEQADQVVRDAYVPESRWKKLRGRMGRISVRALASWIVVMVVAGIAWFPLHALVAPRWRAVFLTNNQVYFGTFFDVPFSSSITLKDVYYLQISQPIQPQGEMQPEFKLIKLGGEIHGPESEMIIPKANILFWENLKDESPVVSVIRKGENTE